jgi:pimeloyl-ACP methyl ester carboxylesterase
MAVAAPSGFSTGLLLRLVRGLLILAGVLLIALCAAGGFLTYRILTAHNATETVTPQSSFQSNYVGMSFTDSHGGEHEGWLLVGLKGAPTIILCPGYESNRSELLSLGSVLRQNHFNVYVFNFQGPKTKGSYTDLGSRDTEDLQAAIAKVVKQPGVNPHRVGLYGITTGGFAALAVAEQSPLVKALVVDTVYETPKQMFDAQLDGLLGGSSHIFHLLSGTMFRVLTMGRSSPQVDANLPKLGNMPKLFISGRDSARLASATEGLYSLAPQPKRLLIMDQSYTALASGAVKKEYENQVLTFFLQNLPLRAD